MVCRYSPLYYAASDCGPFFITRVLILGLLFSDCQIFRSWSVTASENYVWGLLYFSFFGYSEKGMKDKLQSCGMMKYEKDVPSQMNVVNWRNNFKGAYNRKSVIGAIKVIRIW